MKRKHVNLSIMLILVMLFTIVGYSPAFADTIDYAGALSNFQSLGIIDSSVKNGDSAVTRGQFVKSIAIADNLTAAASDLTGTTIFSDIDPSSVLSGYINAAVNAGIMSGLADGKFHPEQYVTYAQACTVMVKLLGYTDSDVTGSWPNNYLQKAASLDLAKDITLKKNDLLTANVEAVLFDRLFNTVMKKTNATDNGKYFSDVFYADTTVTGTLGEYLILGNSKTNDNLNDNQVLTDKGTLTLSNGLETPTLGGKYKLYVNGSTITKVGALENSLENYAVKRMSGLDITYTDDDGNKKLTLPKVPAYYYHGSFLNYDALASTIQPYSSLIFAKDDNTESYEYAIIVDPCFSQPMVYSNVSDEINNEIKNEILNTEHDYTYSKGYWYTEDISLYYGDVIYLVSDLWNENTYIYVNHTTVNGKITAFSPSSYNPTSLTIGNVTYQFSKYFNKNKFYDYLNSNVVSIGSTKTIILGVDGKILDIYGSN